MSGADFVFSWWLKQWSDTSSTLITLQKCGNVTNSNNNNTLFAPEKPNSFNLNNAFNEPAALFVENPNIMGDTGYYLKYYAMIGVIVMIVNNLNMIIQLFGVVVASRKLHSKLLLRVLNAPIKFFETTPIGRILNRFSKDISGIDQNVMYTIGAFIQTLFRICAILILICAVTPYFILFLIPIVFVYIIIAKKYLKVSRELKRLEAISRSPIYSQFSETLIGVSTIRAYGQEQRFLDEAYKRLDSNHRAYFFLWVSNRWLSIRTDLISSFVVFISGAAMLYGHLPPGWAALTMSYSLDLCEAFLWVIRSHADMEMAMNSVERVQEYSTIEQEAPAVIEGRRPPSNWPTAGVVEVKNLYVQYSPESPAVLRDLSFTTKKFEKIGIVGRTGAGKSTLSLAFFRIFKFAEGSITIDGIDVEQIGLRDLRSKLTIIPQDPILFTGTLRSNLDPVGDHDDAEIWGALKRVHFLDSLQDVSASNEEVTPDSSEEGTVVEDNLINIDETPFEERPVFNEENCSLLSKNSFDGAESLNSSNSNFRISLDAFVSENGSNFSQGQRQLLCLARALLKISKLIILDEATASVDNLTDLRIQETIRSEFVNSTVLSIAHRLRTVIDYDRILVLDQGEIVEFDSPYLLMEKRGYFYKMCEESGELDDLYEAAKLKHDSIVN
ncbi:hypothetical protein HDU92_007963 [Lobulomyces angularis]|nr:hypothetical protein HDU92_007963 [Lobulomyces angularis]